QGTSAPVAAMLAFIPKVAGFVALCKLLGYLSPLQVGPLPAELLPVGRQMSKLLWIIAAVTMTLGNVLALLQDNVKRMLAYSSVAHAGYMLIGLTVAPYQLADNKVSTDILTTNGVAAVLFYLVAYGAMTVGAFAILAYLSTKERSAESLEDLGGLSKTHPGTALLMTLFMLSLIGIPPLPG